MNTKFKAGDTKVRCGKRAHIYEVTEGGIFGRVENDNNLWIGTDWTVDGRFSATLPESTFDLMPNIYQRAENDGRVS